MCWCVMAFPTCPLFGGSAVFPWKLGTSFTGSSAYRSNFSFLKVSVGWERGIIPQNLVSHADTESRNFRSSAQLFAWLAQTPAVQLGERERLWSVGHLFITWLEWALWSFRTLGSLAWASKLASLSLLQPKNPYSLGSWPVNQLTSPSLHSTLLKPNVAGFCFPLSLLSPASLCVN